jgi:hypothetical protein
MAKTVTVTRDNTKGFLEGLRALAETKVYAGVPASTAGRKDEGVPLNNAEIMHIHEFGAPESNIPARPVIYPAIKAIRKDIISMLATTAKGAMSGNGASVMKGLGALGLLAQNAMRERITTGPFVPLSPKTIAARARKRGTKRRKGEKDYLAMVKDGMDPAEAQTAAGIRPLVDTGQLRRALTYVIRKVQWSGKKTKL